IAGRARRTVGFSGFLVIQTFNSQVKIRKSIPFKNKNFVNTSQLIVPYILCKITIAKTVHDSSPQKVTIHGQSYQDRNKKQVCSRVAGVIEFTELCFG
ncbi:hypothetical protein D7V86_15330, partial [bacterium D16-51]